jgi:hypothetical protein
MDRENRSVFGEFHASHTLHQLTQTYYIFQIETQRCMFMLFLERLIPADVFNLFSMNIYCLRYGISNH